jgi:hypothetical protein
VPNESITSAKIANLTIQNEDISPGAVGSGKIANGAIGTQDLADGSVTNAKLADHSVGSAKLVNGSVTTADLAGADIHGSISGTLGAIDPHSCKTFEVDLGGAKVGDVAVLTFVGDNAAPAGLTFQIIKVNAPDKGTLRYCNPTGQPSPAFNNVGVRVLTFH